MNEQIKDGKIKKVKGMLFEAEKSLSLEYEKRLSSIRELALYIVALMNKKEKPFSDIKELLSRDVEEFGFHRELLPENKHLVLRGISYLHNFDKALLCESLIREWEELFWCMRGYFTRLCHLRYFADIHTRRRY